MSGVRYECGNCDEVFYGLAAFDKHMNPGYAGKCPAPAGPRRTMQEAHWAAVRADRAEKRRQRQEERRARV